MPTSTARVVKSDLSRGAAHDLRDSLNTYTPGRPYRVWRSYNAEGRFVVAHVTTGTSVLGEPGVVDYYPASLLRYDA